MSTARRSSTLLRTSLVSVLAALYLVLTVNALTCGVNHAFASAGVACAMEGGGMAQSMGHAGPSDDKRLSKALCQCLDKLAAHGPSMLSGPPALQPAPEPLPLLAAGPVPQRSLGPAAPRGPPVQIS